MLHIFIVSLKQDVEKRATISKVLNSFSLDYTFIDAVYGKELSIEYLDSLRNKSSGVLANRSYPATSGEIGCTLSHLKTYQEVIDRGLEWACILEDDVILDERFEMFIKQFQSNNLDIHNLYLLGGQTPSSKKYIIKSIKNIKNIGSQNFYKTIKSERIIFRTCCYLIRSNLAESLISLAADEFILADDWVHLVEKGLVRSIYLAEFVEHPVDLANSNIQIERDSASSKVKIENLPLSLKQRVILSGKFRLRQLALHLYKYIERKESL